MHVRSTEEWHEISHVPLPLLFENDCPTQQVLSLREQGTQLRRGREKLQRFEDERVRRRFGRRRDETHNGYLAKLLSRKLNNLLDRIVNCLFDDTGRRG